MMLFALASVVLALRIHLASESASSHVAAILHDHDFLPCLVLGLGDVDCLELLVIKLRDWN